MDNPEQNSSDEHNRRPDVMRSPIQPRRPNDSAPLNTPPSPAAPRSDSPPPSPESPTNPNSVLVTLRRKIESVVDEFSNGKINRAQFNAIYQRYSEQRQIIERLIDRNPNSDAWKQVISLKGQTGFLRDHFEAQVLYFLVYHNSSTEPILGGGVQKPNHKLVEPVIKMVWSLKNRPQQGLGRKPFGNQWLILAVGDYAATAVVWSLEPSIAQARLVRDLHADFERANRAALARGWIVRERMVFPQRALTDNGMLSGE